MRYAAMTSNLKKWGLDQIYPVFCNRASTSILGRRATAEICQRDAQAKTTSNYGHYLRFGFARGKYFLNATPRPMSAARRPLRTASRAIAAIEFALVSPLLLLALGAASDYGLRSWSRSCLANAVAQGAYYAFRTGTAVTAANVVSLVKNASSLPGSAMGATASDPTKCYCPTTGGSHGDDDGGGHTTATTLGAAVSNCANNCADGTAPAIT
jgi:hypothetical protein